MTDDTRAPKHSLAQLRSAVITANGQPAEDVLGPPPWTIEGAAAWQANHGHDVRLACLTVDRCEVVEAAHERAIAALPDLLACVEWIRDRGVWVAMIDGEDDEDDASLREAVESRLALLSRFRR